MRFEPESLPQDAAENDQAVIDYLQRMFQNAASSINGLYDGEQEVAYSAPPRPREGMIRYADGTTWNPAAVGKGFVYYDGSAWKAWQGAGSYQPLDADLTAIAALGFTSTAFLKKTAANTWALDTNTYLTGNQTISLTGDVSGSGATSISTTLASVITAGGPTGSASVVPVITYDAKGRLTAVSTATITPAAIGAATSGHTHAGVYEPVISAGTTGQYWRGDKTWQTLNPTAVGAEPAITAGTTGQYWRGDKTWQSIAYIFNNMNLGHTARTDFNNIVDYGFNFVQGATNGPGIPSATQYYNVSLGLGNDYNYSQYACEVAWPRTPLGGALYVSMRFREGTTWGSWSKISAGYADNADTVDGVHASGFVSTTYNSSLNSDSRNSRGVTRLYRNDSDSDYSVQTYWNGSYWVLAGYTGDTYHAPCIVYAADFLTKDRTNWSTSPSSLTSVVGQLAWRNYSNNHTIFDASASLTPSGTACSNTTPDYDWGVTYPTLMGWNGTNTYGVRVARAAYSENSDQVDGYHASTSSSANTVMVRDGSQNAVTAGTMSWAGYVQYGFTSQAVNNSPDTWNTYYSGAVGSFGYKTNTGSGYPADWSVVVNFPVSSSNFGFQIAATYGNASQFWMRNKYDSGGWLSWRELIHSGNIGSQTVSNSDKVDGYHAYEGNVASSCVVRDANYAITVGNVYSTGSLTFSTAGVYQAGCIYSDANWGVIIRARQASPNLAEFLFTNSAGTGLVSIASSGRLSANSYEVYNGNTVLTQGAGNSLRVSTNSGYMELGPQNGSWAHLTTDRARFYMSTSLTVNGDIQRYSDSAVYWHSANDGSGSGMDADLLDGVDISNICSGNNGMAASDAQSNMNTLNLKSGFYLYNAPTNSYTGGWTTWLYAAGHYVGDNYGFQIASGYWQNALTFRKVVSNAWSAWNVLIHQDGSDSNRVYISNTSPEVYLYNTGATANQRKGRWIMGNGVMLWDIVNDAVTAYYTVCQLVLGYDYHGPGTDNVMDSGRAGVKWRDVYCARAAFNGSDRNLKYDIYDSNLGLAFIESIRPREYRWKDKLDTGKKHHGFIAQELDEVAGEHLGMVKDGTMINYNELIAPLVKAVQELSAEVKRLKQLIH